tara:strand:+ start:220 stop:522 length:303 start_codon:yes stop_codon:yes gene_type:complete
MKILHFVDAAGTDETFVLAANMNQIRVASNTSVEVRFSNSGNEADDLVTLTTATGKADEVALRLAQEIGAPQIQYGGVLKVIAATAPFADVTTVAYSVGA